MSTEASKPFFLYYASQHTHEPQFASKQFTNTTLRGPFGDSLANLDWAVGEVIAALKTFGVANNTFVFFTSDNGYVYLAYICIYTLLCLSFLSVQP